MLNARFARPADAPAENPLAALPEPTQTVTDTTTFKPSKSYRVRLSAVTEYLGSPLSPMHVHTVNGTVAEAIRASIAAYAPA